MGKYEFMTGLRAGIGVGLCASVSLLNFDNYIFPKVSSFETMSLRTASYAFAAFDWRDSNSIRLAELPYLDAVKFSGDERFKGEDISVVLQEVKTLQTDAKVSSDSSHMASLEPRFHELGEELMTLAKQKDRQARNLFFGFSFVGIGLGDFYFYYKRRRPENSISRSPNV